MQINPAYPQHIRTKESGVRMDQQLQQEWAISLALALQHKFNVNGTVLEWVKLLKYLGRMIAQDDDDAQAMQQQLQKARGVWAQVGRVLHRENVTPWVAAKFYKAGSSIPSSYTGVRHGTSQQPPWQGWRGSTSVWHVRWREKINQGGEPTTPGPILGQQMCWRSAGCGQLQTTFARINMVMGYKSNGRGQGGYSTWLSPPLFMVS
jgi:hypothetical protein